MNYPKKIKLCEVGPRDGLQKAKRRLSAAEKADLINRAADAGFKEIEFGAFTGFKEVNLMDDSGEVFKLIDRKEDVIYRALVSDASAIERAAGYGVDTVKISVFASEHIHGPIDDKVQVVQQACNKANELGVRVFGSISLPFAGPQDGIVPYENVARLVGQFREGGITRVSLGDASGMANPKLIQDRLEMLKSDFPEITWVLHLHDTWGMGFANVIAGIEAGITCFDSSFAGLGGCPFIKGGRGNIASEQMVYMLDAMGIETGIDLDKAYQTAKYVQSLDVGITNSPYVTSRAGLDNNQ